MTKFCFDNKINHIVSKHDFFFDNYIAMKNVDVFIDNLFFCFNERHTMKKEKRHDVDVV